MMAEEIVEDVGRHLSAVPMKIGHENGLDLGIRGQRARHAEVRLMATQAIRAPSSTPGVAVPARPHIGCGYAVRLVFHGSAIEAAHARCEHRQPQPRPLGVQHLSSHLYQGTYAHADTN